MKIRLSILVTGLSLVGCGSSELRRIQDNAAAPNSNQSQANCSTAVAEVKGISAQLAILPPDTNPFFPPMDLSSFWSATSSGGFNRKVSAEELGIEGFEDVGLNQLNVPINEEVYPVPGFPNHKTGANIQDPFTSGQDLGVFYSLLMETKVRLNSTMPAGYYYLGALADDGLIVEYKTDGMNEFQNLLVNDGLNPPTIVCSNADQYIYFSKETLVSLRIRYFQGIGTKRALQVFFMPVPPAVSNGSQARDEILADDRCGQVVDTASQFDEIVSSEGWNILDETQFIQTAAKPSVCE